MLGAVVQFSILHMFLLVAVAATACMSLKFANPVWWSSLLGVGIPVFLAIGIIGLVGRGEQRTFAIGFTFSAVIYMGMISSAPIALALPSTKLLTEAHRVIATTHSIERDRSMYPGQQSGLQTRRIERPNRTVFLRIAHFWFAALLGGFGGLFARWVERRQGTKDREVGDDNRRS